MSELELVLQSIDKLTAEGKLRVVAYTLDTAKPHVGHLPKERIFGLHPDAIELSDNFIDELPDSFWLGKNNAVSS